MVCLQLDEYTSSYSLGVDSGDTSFQSSLASLDILDEFKGVHTWCLMATWMDFVEVPECGVLLAQNLRAERSSNGCSSRPSPLGPDFSRVKKVSVKGRKGSRVTPSLFHLFFPFFEGIPCSSLGYAYVVAIGVFATGTRVRFLSRQQHSIQVVSPSHLAKS